MSNDLTFGVESAAYPVTTHQASECLLPGAPAISWSPRSRIIWGSIHYFVRNLLTAALPFLILNDRLNDIVVQVVVQHMPFHLPPPIHSVPTH